MKLMLNSILFHLTLIYTLSKPMPVAPFLQHVVNMQQIFSKIIGVLRRLFLYIENNVE